MTFEIDGTFVLVGLLIPGVLLFAFFTFPRWFVRSMSNYALWRLRDDVVDDILAGRLDREHPAVSELAARVEWSLREARSFDLLHLLVWSRARRSMPTETLRRLERVPSLHGLDEGQAHRVGSYRTRYNDVATRTILLSSWIGISVVFCYGIPAAMEVLRRRARDNSLREVIRVATDEVAAETSLGRSARDFVSDIGPQENHALV